MPNDRYAIVVTTINSPTPAVEEIARGASSLRAQFIIIGDTKSPAQFHQNGAKYMDVAAQAASGFQLAAIAPTRHYARKNIGYLEAVRNGADIIIETDDDDIPLDSSGLPREAAATARVVPNAGSVNVYDLFHNANVFQKRNERSLIRDVQDEVPGYLENSEIADRLDGLSPNAGVDAIFDNLRICYQALVAGKHVGSEELPLLDAWLADLTKCSAAPALPRATGE